MERVLAVAERVLNARVVYRTLEWAMKSSTLDGSGLV